MSGTTETGNEHLVILVNETHATISGDVASNSLVVLLELHSDALTHGGVGLLGFDTDLLDDDTGSVGGALERLLPGGTGVGFLVGFVSPPNRLKNKFSVSESHYHWLQTYSNNHACCAPTYLFNLLLTLSLRPALIPLGFPLPILIYVRVCYRT